MDRLKYIVFFVLTCVSLTVFGQIHTGESSYERAVVFIKSHTQGQDYSIVSQEKIFFENSEELSSRIFNLHPQGFITISADTKHVLAYSFENNRVAEGSEEFDFFSGFINGIALKENALKEVVAENIEDQTHGPYVYNMWGQVNCTDNTGYTINVNNLFTPNNYAPGCVAISQASILKHYNWPPKGVGVKTYSDTQGSSTGTYTADFENEAYDWENALDRYRSKTSTQIEREAAGKVAFHAAVSLAMNFEYNGSTSNVNRIPSALANHFRFTALYKDRGSSTFWSLLDSNMVWKKPAVLAVENSNGGGHSVVCDGLKIDDGDYFYHLNMGWWGVSNGWYKIRNSFDAGGYNYVIGATMNIIAEPVIDIPVVLDNAPETQLTWRYPENGYAEAYEIQRSINGGSWETITNTITETSLTIFPVEGNSYEYRARAKVNNGRFYLNSWSNVVKLGWNYTGLENQALDKTKVFPSPFSSNLNISLPDNLKTSVRVNIYNQQGILFFQEQVNNTQKININTANWNIGVYIIHILYGNDSQISKIIKI